MINTDNVISDLKNRLKTLIQNNTLNARCDEDVNGHTVSFYIYKHKTPTEPLLILRISDHKPNMQKMIRGTKERPSTEENTNISIEFYRVRRNQQGKRIKNRFNNKIFVPDSIPAVEPFSMTSYSYKSSLLTLQDVEVIYGAMLIWLFRQNGNVPFDDPFKGTEKEAMFEKKTSEVTTRSSDNNGNEENSSYKPQYKITKRELKQMINECVREVMQPSCS